MVSVCQHQKEIGYSSWLMITVYQKALNPCELYVVTIIAIPVACGKNQKNLVLIGQGMDTKYGHREVDQKKL